MYFDKRYLYTKNVEQSKYQNPLTMFNPISDEAGYDIIETSNDQIIPVSKLTDDNQKIVIKERFCL